MLKMAGPFIWRIVNPETVTQLGWLPGCLSQIQATWDQVKPQVALLRVARAEEFCFLKMGGAGTRPMRTNQVHRQPFEVPQTCAASPLRAGAAAAVRSSSAGSPGAELREGWGGG